VTVARFDHRDLPLDTLLAAKRAQRISLCIPARNEEATIGAIVEQVVGHPLLDEVVVVDDHSEDDTAAVAMAAGASVVAAADTLPAYGSGPGKGQALWKAVACSSGDLLAFVDADLEDFSLHYISGLLGPLLLDETVGFVKAFYERPGDGHPRGGGRVTELMARPLLHALFPHLHDVVQPLAGEFAGRRAVFEQLSFVDGYGVDIALLIDIARTFGVGTVAQVDLGIRVHRNRPLPELGPMATVILLTALERAGIEQTPEQVELFRPELPPVTVTFSQRPPLASIPEYGAAGRGGGTP
jgi:glucosyl-3-phosphoglycerate synthase